MRFSNYILGGAIVAFIGFGSYRKHVQSSIVKDTHKSDTTQVHNKIDSIDAYSTTDYFNNTIDSISVYHDNPFNIYDSIDNKFINTMDKVNNNYIRK